MINLRKMNDDEFPAYCEYFIEDYSREIISNYGHSKEKALKLAEQELTNSFPEGVESLDHELLCIEISNTLQTAGYLWHSINRSSLSTYIYDFYIHRGFRGNGYGKLAIKILEDQLCSAGIKQIKLRVAYENSRALELYKESGFIITGYNMSKNLQ